MPYAKILDIDDTEYFKLKAIDQSQLKQFIKSPHYWAYKRLNDDYAPTGAQEFGTAFHAFLLGTSDVVCLPEGETFRSKDNQDWRDEQIACGNIVVSYSDMQTLKRMRDGIAKTSQRDDCVDFMGMIEEGTAEQCIVWEDGPTGLQLKAKPDLIPVGTDFLVDLKTAQKADKESFAKEVVNWGYHIQTVFYRAAVGACEPGAFDRGADVPDTMQFWVFAKTDDCNWNPYSISANNEIAANAATSIRQALLGLATKIEAADKAGYCKDIEDPLDAAAQYILDKGEPKKVEEVEFQTWQLLEAENMIVDLSA